MPQDALSIHPSMIILPAAAIGGLIAVAAYSAMTTASTETASTNEPEEVTYPYDLWGSTVHLGISPAQMESQHRTAIEATMPGCQHGWFTSSYDKKQLHYRKFLPSQKKPKAIIVFHHGIQDHSGSAFISKAGNKLGTALLVDILVKQQGYALYAMDQLGHGYSEGRRMYMPSYKSCVQDLVAFTKLAGKDSNSNAPVFVMGKSLGGNFAIHATVQLQEQANKNFAGMILLCAALKGDLPPPPVTYFLREILAPRYPTWCPFFMPNPVSPKRIWRDTEALEMNTSSEYKGIGLEAAGDPMLLGTAVQCLEGLDDACSTEIAKVTAPFVAIHGIKDHAVPVESLDLLEASVATPKADQTVVRLPESFHDLLCDPDAELVMEHIVQFVNGRLGKK